MSAGFQLLCESAPLATMMMAFALFWLARRRSTATRSHLVVMAACILALAAPLLITALPKWRVLPSFSSPRIANETRNANDSISRPSSSQLVGAGIAQRKSYPLWFRLAGGVWLAGSAFCLTACALRQAGLRRLLAEGTSAPPPTLTLAMRLRSRRGIRREVRLMVHHADGSPFTCGLWNPCIVLPASHEKMSYADLRMVLDHEMAHIQRLDALHGWILEAFLAMWWFHPLAWLTFRHAEVIKERACDDLVLLSGEDPRRYAACLGEAVLRAHRHPSSLAMVSNFVRKAPQLARMHAILDPTVDRSHLTSRETLSACAPMTLAAVVLSSLGFKAASELQPLPPALLASEPGARVPSLWSDTLEPLARSVGIAQPQQRAEHQEIPATRTQNHRHTASSPLRVGPSRANHPIHRFQAQTQQATRRSTRSDKRNHALPEPGAGPEHPEVFTHSPPSFVRNQASSPRISPIAGNAPITGSPLAAAPVPVGAAESFAFGVAGHNGNSQAYGYVALDDAGVLVYSGIHQSASAGNPNAEAGGAIVADSGVISSDSILSTTAIDSPASSTESAPLGQATSSADPAASHDLLTPEDMGIRNLQASIENSTDGGHLSVSFEVPEQTANFWTAEASADAQSWTDSEDVISHEFSSGTSPGFLLLRASLLEPIPSAHHTQLRLRGKW